MCLIQSFYLLSFSWFLLKIQNNMCFEDKAECMYRLKIFQIKLPEELEGAWMDVLKIYSMSLSKHSKTAFP